jgi:hypothetical protein
MVVIAVDGDGHGCSWLFMAVRHGNSYGNSYGGHGCSNPLFSSVFAPKRATAMNSHDEEHHLRFWPALCLFPSYSP